MSVATVFDLLIWFQFQFIKLLLCYDDGFAFKKLDNRNFVCNYPMRISFENIIFVSDDAKWSINF